jgi:hypothetical protein
VNNIKAALKPVNIVVEGIIEVETRGRYLKCEFTLAAFCRLGKHLVDGELVCMPDWVDVLNSGFLSRKMMTGFLCPFRSLALELK